MLNLKNDIPGWMSTNDLYVLAKIASLVPNNTNILEIGSFLGRSTYTIFLNKPLDVSMTVVDTFKICRGYYLDNSDLLIDDPNCSIDKLNKSIEVSRKENSWRAGFESCIGKEIYDQLEVHITDSKNFTVNKKYSLVFLDGSHAFDDVIYDLIKYNDTETLLVGDDFGRKHHGVASALSVFGHISKRSLVVLGGTKIWISIPISGYWNTNLNLLNNL